MSSAAGFLSDEDSVDFGPSLDVPSTMARAPLRTQGAFEQRVLALTLRQITDLARLVAASTSIINRLGQDVSRAGPEATLLANLPGIITPDSELINALVRSNLPVELVADTQAVYTRLAAVRTMTASYCRFPAELAAKGGVHIDTLVGGWRDLAAQVRALILAMSALVVPARGSSPDYAQKARYGRTLYLAAACADGAAPCVLDDGTVEIPDIVERRHHERYTVDWLGYAYIADRVADVRIVDFSAGGLCMVVGTPWSEEQAKTAVLVEIIGHAKLTGVIVWQASSSFGIKFDKPLEMAHPLLVAAQGKRRV